MIIAFIVASIVIGHVVVAFNSSVITITVFIVVSVVIGCAVVTFIL